LAILPGANAQLTITNSTITTTGSTPLLATYQQPQQFQTADGRLYPASSIWAISRPPSPPGQLNCVNCAPTDTDYVGPYTLNMACPNSDHQYRRF
jgi:hypothetical protein